MLPASFIYLAMALRLLGGASYTIATITGRAKPNTVSWLLWGIVPLVAFAASVQAGAGSVALVTLALGISPIIVFVTAMVKNHRSLELRGFNLLCAVVAILGIIIWQVTHQPQSAIIAMIFADFISSLPTIIKSRKNPSSEFPYAYMLSALSMIVTLGTITEWNIATASFPIYVLALNSYIFYLTIRKKINS